MSRSPGLLFASLHAFRFGVSLELFGLVAGVRVLGRALALQFDDPKILNHH
jgi:hypothetical protein